MQRVNTMMEMMLNKNLISFLQIKVNTQNLNW